MPNWCQNTLTVQGKEQDVQDFIDMNRDGESTDGDARILSFDRLVPLPEQLKDPSAGDAWYNWQVTNWGTKWDASSVDDWTFTPSEDENMFAADLRFDTAWSPPVSWLEHISERFPELTITLDYVEHGMGFSGFAVAEDGYFSDHITEYESPDEDDEGVYF